MAELRIRCINKDNGDHANPHEAITHYGWLENGVTQKEDRQTMVNRVKNGLIAYVENSEGKRADCNVRTSSNGTEFLQTHSDGYYNDNLLSLKECA